mgnify:CR=1 FL=1
MDQANGGGIKRKHGSDDPLDFHLLDLGDCLCRVQSLRTNARAIHDGVAPIQAERILERVETFAGHLVAAVGEPAIGLEQDRRPQELIGVPPIAGARRRAAGAQDALVQAVELLALLGRLQALFLGRRRRRAGPSS